MSDLIKYVTAHTERGECQCGKCFDKGDRPDPAGHTVDLVFFKVSAIDNPDRERFITLTKEHRGEFNECDPFDGIPHNYLELGGWIGDQGLAMLFMGLGSLLGCFRLISGKNHGADDETAMRAAEGGYLMIQAEKESAKVPAGWDAVD